MKNSGETPQDNGTIELEGTLLIKRILQTLHDSHDEDNKQTVITFPLNSFTF